MRFKKFLPLLVLALSLLPVLWPLLHAGFFVSDDGEWMVVRLAAFVQTLKTGQFPVRFLWNLNHGYGYPVLDFLYPLPFYLGSLIHFLGAGFVDSIKILFGSSFVFGALGTYFLVRRKFGQWSAVAAAIIYTYQPYRLFDVYRRGSLGEAMAFLFIPVTAYFLVRMLSDQKRVYFVLSSLAWAALVLSHNSLALISAPVIFAISLILADRINLKSAMRIISSFMAALLLSAFFWIPALVDLSATRASATMVADFHSYFLTGGNFNQLIGLPVVLAILLVLIIIRKRSIYTFSLLGIFLLGIFFASGFSQIFWQLPLLPKIVQFPYRFLSVCVIVLPLLIVKLENKASMVALCLIALLFVIFSYPLLQIRSINKGDAYYVSNDDTTTVQNEYMSRWIVSDPKNLPKERINVLSGKGKSFGKVVIMEKPGAIQLQTMYFPGVLLEVNGKLVPFDFKRSGLLETGLPVGIFLVEPVFSETPTRLFSDAISICGVVILLLVLAWPKNYLPRFSK